MPGCGRAGNVGAGGIAEPGRACMSLVDELLPLAEDMPAEMPPGANPWTSCRYQSMPMLAQDGILLTYPSDFWSKDSIFMVPGQRLDQTMCICALQG